MVWRENKTPLGGLLPEEAFTSWAEMQHKESRVTDGESHLRGMATELSSSLVGPVLFPVWFHALVLTQLQEHQSWLPFPHLSYLKQGPEAWTHTAPRFVRTITWDIDRKITYIPLHQVPLEYPLDRTCVAPSLRGKLIRGTQPQPQGLSCTVTRLKYHTLSQLVNSCLYPHHSDLGPISP